LGDLYGDWAAIYDSFYADRSDEAAFWTGQARAFGRRVLDLMCGTAEVSLALARQGLRVLGVDRSPAMLAVAAWRLEAAADYPARGLRLVQADACAIPSAGASFDFALVGGSGSFNHLDQSHVDLALWELARTLRPGGGLGLELANPHLVAEMDPERAFGPMRAPMPGASLVRRMRTRLHAATGRLWIHQVTEYEYLEQRDRFEESFVLQLYGVEEIGERLRAAGFGDLRFAGDPDLTPFSHWSPDLLVLATRQAQP
jgi:ubiquinone/menaquinone biosynthesis C-methylase UbiE